MARGLSLVRFAQLMNVSRPTVWSWEAGKSFPRAAKEKRILEVLDVQKLASESPGKGQMAGQPSRYPVSGTDQIRNVADEAKERVAAAAGVSPDKVKVIIEI